MSGAVRWRILLILSAVEMPSLEGIEWSFESLSIWTSWSE